VVFIHQGESMSVEWKCMPERVSWLRIDWLNCPPFIQAAYGRRRPLFELGSDLAWVWRERYYCRMYPGCICDLTSVPRWVPGWIASRQSATNYQDVGSGAHDMGHRGVARFPGVESRRVQGRMWDAMALDLWREKAERLGVGVLDDDVSRWRLWARTRAAWKRGGPLRKYIGVRLAAPFIFRPNYENLDSDWMVITDMEETRRVEVENEDA